MKKAITIILAVVALGITSCKKNWTCACQLKAGGVENAVLAEKMKKKDAKAICDNADVSQGSPYASCSLK